MSTDTNDFDEAKTSSDKDAAASAGNHPTEQYAVEQPGDGKMVDSDDVGAKPNGQPTLREDSVSADLLSAETPKPDDMTNQDSGEAGYCSHRASPPPALVLLSQSWVGHEAGSRLLQRVCAFVAPRRKCCSVNVLSSGTVVIPKIYYDNSTTVADAGQLIQSKLGETSFFLFAGTDRTTVLDRSCKQPIQQYLTEKTGWCLSIDIRLSDLRTLKSMGGGKWCTSMGWSSATSLSSAKGVGGNEFVESLDLCNQGLKGMGI